MQKAALFAALTATVGLTVYAFPGADKRSGPLFQTSASAIERGGPAPSALDKLKAATRTEHASARSDTALAEPTSVLPAPRVMESVRQELLTRPVLTDAAPGQAIPATASDQGLHRLVARLPAPQPPVSQLPAPAAQFPSVRAPAVPAGPMAAFPSVPAASMPVQAAAALPAAVQPATIVVPGATTALTPPPAKLGHAPDMAGGAVAKSGTFEPAAVPTPVVSHVPASAHVPASGHAAAKPERRRIAHRATVPYGRQAAAQPVTRAAYAPSVFKRNDGS